MNLAAFAIRYRPVVVTLVMLLMAWGLVSFFTMPRREDPEYTVRTCAVSTSWPGAPATKVEELITKPIEEACDRIDAVKIVRSITTNGLSTVFVDAEETVSAEAIDNVWNKVRANVARVQMPEQGISPIVNDEYGDTYVILAAVFQTPQPGENEIDPRHEYSLRKLDMISERIEDELRLLDGVAKSEQYGVVEEAIYAETDAGTWSQLQLTSDQLQQLVQSRNIVAPGGTIDTKSGRFFVKPGGELNAVEELNSIVTGLAGEGDDALQVYLPDQGVRVVRDYVDPRQVISRFGDANTKRPAVMVALSIKSGANIVNVCEAAKARIDEMRNVEQSIPPDIGIEYISDQSKNVTEKIQQVLSNVIGAVVIVVIVVYLVVGFRSAMVMAANIPVVVLAAIALVTLFGVQLEQISLASIIIALGLLVDNAVQVCDQSRTNQIEGMSPIEASIKGTTQLSTAMLMGTATTIAAFAPMLIGLVGSTREYVYSLPVTLSITLGISWVLAMTFCTILAAAFIRAPVDPTKPSAPLPWLFAKLTALITRRKGSDSAVEPESDPLDRIFGAIVRACIDFKFVTIGVAVALLVVTLKLPVASEFFPKDMRDQFPIQIFLPENSTIEQTDIVARQVETIIQKLSPLTDTGGQSVTDESGDPIQQVRAFRTMIGRGGSRWYLSWNPEPANAAYAEVLVRTTDAKFTPELVRRVREIAERGDETLGLKPIVGARIIPQELQLGPSEDPVEIRVAGAGFADMPTLHRFADRVKELIRNTPGTWSITDSWGVSGYQLQVNVDEDSASLAGVTNLDIANTLNADYSGHQLTTFREGDHLVPVYLRLTGKERKSLDSLQTAFVEATSGTKVPLDAIATLTPRWEPATIERRDLNRVISVSSQVEPGVLGNDVVKGIMRSPEMQQIASDMPAGFRVEVGGNLEKSNENAAYLAVCLSISILTIILLLVIQYNGWAKPIIILATLPLALIGALPGLYFTDNALGFMPQLGILSLFGIVLNTGIIFIEFADLLIKDAAEKSDGTGPICGLTRDQFRNCLVDACKQRLLPIFLTTATTIGGLLPLAMSGGPLWEGMSWCMIYGLIVATLLTLLVVPALYAMFVETFRVQPVAVEPE
ncbi:MAG: efflux RND transporter permease subunit [Planctomycetota bacterium]|nr:efflux RND transporter permease subunit [Planctomycetota bacterium]